MHPLNTVPDLRLLPASMQPDHIGSRCDHRQAKRKQLSAHYRNRAPYPVIAGVTEFEFVCALKSPAPFIIAPQPNAFHGNSPVEQLHAFGFARPAGSVECDIARAQTIKPEPAGAEEHKQNAKFNQGKSARRDCRQGSVIPTLTSFGESTRTTSAGAIPTR
jgi:hypothetical protein